MTGFYTNPSRAPEPRPKGRKRKREARRRRGAFWAPTDRNGTPIRLRQVLLVLVLLAAAALLFCYGVVFRVRHIFVDGCHAYSEAQVASVCGVSLGDSMLSVTEEKVAAAINKQIALVFVRLDRQWNGITITVRERTPAAAVKYSGIYYQVDREGFVLTESMDPNAYAGLPEVSGFTLSGRGSARPGTLLNVTDPQTLTVLSELLLEIRVHSADAIVKVIKIGNLSDILLETADGFSVRLGDASHLRGKIKAMMLVRDELLLRQTGPGTIDVSSYTEPTFIREN